MVAGHLQEKKGLFLYCIKLCGLGWKAKTQVDSNRTAGEGQQTKGGGNAGSRTTKISAC